MQSAKAIQIVTLENHNLGLLTDTLSSIVKQNHLADHKLVLVSIAGAFRKGKSFLLKFFLKYLYAQYKFKDTTNWISRNDTIIQGFKSRGGPERETTGIWMWSEIFTHDYENGEKVAIVLLDSQGIFDDESTLKDCTAIFAMSMMVSSVQCYNLMQNIQEDDLQHLELFTEYGRLAMEQTSEKPFQNLLFLIREWPYPTTYAFGNGQQFIDQKLIGNANQTSDMRQLRQRIQDSFDKIGAFLLPFPGERVSEAEHVSSLKTEDIKQTFIEHVEKLAQSIFAPETLVVKKINGQKLKIDDLTTFLQTYVNIFNGDTLPDPKTVLKATAEATNQLLYGECINNYVSSLDESFKRVPYFEESELLETHQKARELSLSKFQEQRKLGDDILISSFEKKLRNEIEAKFKIFADNNEILRTAHIEKEKAKEQARIAAEEKAKAIERARILAQQKAEAEERARIEAQQKAEAEERARILAQQNAEAEERAKILAQQKAEAEERARIEAERAREAMEIAEEEKRKTQKMKEKNKFGKILKVGAAAITGVVIGGPIGAAVALKEAGDIIDN